VAEDTEQSSKTEEPTGKRLGDARAKGDVAKSQDLVAFFALAGAVGTVSIAGPWMTRHLILSLRPFIEHPADFDLSGLGGVAVMRLALEAAAPAVVVLMATAFCGAAGNFVQHGFLWTPSRLAPSFDKLNPLDGFKRLFGLDNFVTFLKSLAKLTGVSVIAFMIMKPHAESVRDMSRLDPMAILPESLGIIRSLSIAVLLCMGALALFDWFYTRQRFMHKMRMTREEVKQEHKDSDGDPHIKAKLRQKRIEVSKRRMMQNVPKASVVVMNPTHFAVALRYEPGETPAPVCVAKGMDAVALKIREVAEGANVPVIEDPPLARALYAAIDVDETIPREHYQAVAKIIGFVMGRKASSRAAARPMGL
jgi:flagellar biosynthesis protein FlhB